ncbi:hypothetical protein ANCCAN_17508 [Ancylostoma caninum]|uniref:Integrator complex subunit 5 C-terminal domain-containing protein n=1 Tax=Ancylostoma caninum TaxID=29170 RepID=A0A368G0T9_ANCCA|nr:hypothetical protein ANCCAN_17508 [Ancylostoma caninum]
MDVESPASPGIESPASPTSAPAIPVIAEAPEEPEHVEEEPIADVSVGARASAGVEYQRKAYSSAEWCEKYRKITAIYEAFMKLTAMGDVTSVYRRAVWVSLPATELVAPASDAFNCIPASRKAVLGFVGLLIHENAHQCFLSKENPQCAVDYSSVENAAITLMKMVENAVASCFIKQSVIDVLSWCCSISSELSQHNAGRSTLMNLPRGAESILDMFKMVGSVAQLIKLIDATINVLLAKCPDECMTVLFDASRNGSHFNWIWLHIAITFPGSIVDHLFTVGAAQFRAYVEDFKVKERTQDEIVNLIVRAAHSKQNLSVVDYPPAAEFASGKKLQFVIDAAISSPPWAGSVIRYLHAVSIIYGETKAAEIICRFIVGCVEAQSLSALCAFLSTVVPYYPNVMRPAYESLTNVMRMVDKEKDVSRSSILRVLNNIRVLLEWEQTAEDSLQLKYFRLYPDATFGVLYTNLLYEVLNTAEECITAKEMQMAMDLVLAVSRLIEVTAPYAAQFKEGSPVSSSQCLPETGVSLFLKKVVTPISNFSIPPNDLKENSFQQVRQINILIKYNLFFSQNRSVKMLIRHAYKLMLQLAALQRIALSMVCREHDIAISVFEEYRTTIFVFVYQQLNPLLRGYNNLFLLSFLTSCIQDAKALFGDSDDLVAWKYESEERASKLAEIEETQEESFLKAIEAMPLGRRPNQLAHSGVIGKGARHLQKVEPPSEDSLHRAHVFLDAMRTTCLSHTRESNLETCKLVAEVMTEALCQDALGGDFLFQDWDIERDFVSKFLEISKRLDSSWISQGLMEIVAENPPCLWFMLPVVKAELATIMTKYENVVDKSKPPTEEMVDRFDRWLYIVRKGDILSERFELTIEIIPHVSCYEGFLLLLEIWRHFQRRGASYNSVQAVHSAILKGEDARLHDAKALFGDSDDLVAWKYESEERASKLAEIEEAQEESFLKAIEAMPLGRRPNQLAHSGVIGKGARHLQKVEPPSEDSLHRAHVFLDAMRTTCLSHTRESNLETCKLVAEVMTEALCQDALGGDFLFQDWDIERDFVSKFLEISKRLDSSWISQGLMEIVAENPPCLWFMLPVVKAELATIMTKYENVVDKSKPPTEEMVDRFDRWLYIVRKGDILSERFELTIEIIPHVSCYEGFLLLLEIWRHFQRRGASYNSVQAVHSAILKGEDARLHITMDSNTEMFRLVLQKNIADLGHLFPLLYVSETPP